MKEGATRVRRAQNGGLIIEVMGPEGASKADALAVKLSEMLGGEAYINRPIKKGEVRITGLDESTSVEEVVSAVARASGCEPAAVRAGYIRRMRNGLGTVWIQCPLAAALAIADVGKIYVGWTVARVTLLQSRPLQCFRCWGYGHMRVKCQAAVDRSGHCFRCGESSHEARSCGATSETCAICKKSDRPAGHRMGTASCPLFKEALASMNARWSGARTQRGFPGSNGDPISAGKH